MIDQRGGAGHFVVGTDNGVAGGVGQRHIRAGERDGALDLQRRRRSRRAVERDRAAGDGIVDQLHRAAVIRHDLAGCGVDVGDVAINLQHPAGLRLQRGARLVGDGVRSGIEDQLVGKAGGGGDVAVIVQRQIGVANAAGAADGVVIVQRRRAAVADDGVVAVVTQRHRATAGKRHAAGDLQLGRRGGAIELDRPAVDGGARQRQRAAVVNLQRAGIGYGVVEQRHRAGHLHRIVDRERAAP